MIMASDEQIMAKGAPAVAESSTANRLYGGEDPSSSSTLTPQVAGKPKPVAFSWGKPPSTTQATNLPVAKKPASLAEIMAEESETRLAAQVVYQDKMSLAELEAEQERLLRSFQEQKHSASLTSALKPPISAQLKHPPPSASTVRKIGNADREFSQRAMDEIERTEIVIDNPNNSLEEERRKQSAMAASARAPPKLWMGQATKATNEKYLSNVLPEEAKAHLSEQEILEIEMALREADMDSETGKSLAPAVASLPSESAAVAQQSLSEDETAAIEAALREADAKQEEESYMLALQMQQQELGHLKQKQSLLPQGNVRSMTRAELDSESQRIASVYAGPSSSLLGVGAITDAHQQELRHAAAPGIVIASHPPPRHPMDHGYGDEDHLEGCVGFRMNSASAQEWARRDRNTIIGPNDEIRTKHDVHVQGQANAQYLGLDEDDFGLRTHVGNQAFNSFKKNMKRTTKGVATHGTGRAGADSDAVKGKAMDPHVRLQISKAINNGLIQHCNGAVKQGKEAVVYHAEQGAESQGHDVAVKVFKRITEFRGRGAYVDGDPRYFGENFRKKSEREQLELWAEKEYRNLVRAHRSKVPVPTPLHFKENIVFMRFMGNDGWPSPQIREIQMKKGSRKWDILYTQVLEAIRRLYVGAKLVHGDLSEYNILVAPSFQVEHFVASVEDNDSDLQAVLIDFGQAVEVRHPEAEDLLLRDLERVRSFFVKQGVTTLNLEDSFHFVKDEPDNREEVEIQNEPTSNTVEALS